MPTQPWGTVHVPRSRWSNAHVNGLADAVEIEAVEIAFGHDPSSDFARIDALHEKVGRYA
jgi:hypothetical protein